MIDLEIQFTRDAIWHVLISHCQCFQPPAIVKIHQLNSSNLADEISIKVSALVSSEKFNTLLTASAFVHEDKYVVEINVRDVGNFVFYLSFNSDPFPDSCCSCRNPNTMAPKIASRSKSTLLSLPVSPTMAAWTCACPARSSRLTTWTISSSAVSISALGAAPYCLG